MESFPGSPPRPAGSHLLSVQQAKMEEEDGGKEKSLMTVSVDHQREKNELLP